VDRGGVEGKAAGCSSPGSVRNRDASQILFSRTEKEREREREYIISTGSRSRRLRDGLRDGLRGGGGRAARRRHIGSGLRDTRRRARRALRHSGLQVAQLTQSTESRAQGRRTLGLPRALPPFGTTGGRSFGTGVGTGAWAAGMRRFVIQHTAR
jgi:hypothetical protein